MRTKPLRHKEQLESLLKSQARPARFEAYFKASLLDNPVVAALTACEKDYFGFFTYLRMKPRRFEKMPISRLTSRRVGVER